MLLLLFYLGPSLFILYIVFLLIRGVMDKYKTNNFNSKVKNIGNIIYYERCPMSLSFNYKLDGGAKVYFEFKKGKLAQIDLRTKDKASLWFVRQKEDSTQFTAYCYSKDNKRIDVNIFHTLYGFPTTVTAWVEWLNQNIPSLKLPPGQFATV